MKIAESILEKLSAKVKLVSGLSKLEIESVLQALADNDINAKEDSGSIMVEPSDLSSAKKIIQKMKLAENVNMMCDTGYHNRCRDKSCECSCHKK